MSLRHTAAAFLMMGNFVALPGCSEAPSAKEIREAPISHKTRAENAHARIEKTYRLSEIENIKVVIVPGHPLGERCVIYTNGAASAMQCREILPNQQ